MFSMHTLSPITQVNTMLKRALATEKTFGRVNDDRRAFVQANLTAMAPSPAKDGVVIPGINARARATGLPMTSAKRGLARAENVRKQLSEHEEGLLWATVTHARCMYHCLFLILFLNIICL